MAIIISLLTNNPNKEIERYFEVYRNWLNQTIKELELR
jgi:hypothetical protein